VKWSFVLLPAVALVVWTIIASLIGQFIGAGEKAQFIVTLALLTLGIAAALVAITASAYSLLRRSRMTHLYGSCSGLWIVLTVAIAPAFVSTRVPIVDYRHVTNLSSCRDVTTAETNQGSVLVEAKPDSEVADATWYVLDGKLDSRPVEIVVSCFKNRLMHVHYRTEVEGESELALFHDRLHNRLASAYGKTEIKTTPYGRVSRWCFKDPFEPGGVRFRRAFLVGSASAMLYIVSSRRDSDTLGYRVDVGLDFNSIEC
jgi:hypothetical protein